ncbi:CARDB domain-containing protein [Solirubrobacter soli]|uniref:CARDB domain-containing protein n=1 Tax=Solirubrobacter soli TaxID=363832 RepID=UPI0004842BA2|nr:CARDB domain-containing protein [Solirubrobacter soli]
MMLLTLQANEWVGMFTAVVGIILSATSLVLGQRQRAAEARAKTARDHLDDAEQYEREQLSLNAATEERARAQRDAMRRRAEAERAYEDATRALPWRRRISFKAVAAASIGTMTVLGAGLTLAAADVNGETISAQDTAGMWFWAVVAVLLGFSARRDVKAEPGRYGIKLAWVGIGTAVFAVLATAAPPQPAESSPEKPNLVVAILDDCTGYRVMNDGPTAAGAFQVVGTNSGGSSSFAHDGLPAGQVADFRFFDTGDRSEGLTTVRVDATNAVAESDESDNGAQLLC